MCGPSRPSSGSLIAVIFPSSSSASSSSSPPSSSSSSSSNDSTSPTTNPSYYLFFKNTTHPASDTQTGKESRITTKALFRIPDPLTRRSFQESAAVYMRIEKYGDLTVENTSPPLHYFRLPMMKMQGGGGGEEFEVTLPERLELGVSGRGIVGRDME
ncbi:hypothetical protein BO79DRAFT_269368 [Aspergillus costaricaensis CBS 115574]|uniref:Uncharacterized protein n=1 Tax=Aspergillus costaricaensis CBS 115574 TaxID=1448317 RepID=A0ACD1ICJ6_9EURO|nr:hypothetical protein BO79DRAFT_269368 [Aspergillus costaricaensis CBS 115574]RAK87496.1 hypothetical protein BO79DRAFT_269368 [Aspergillus costaricaensis CBS 115574]